MQSKRLGARPVAVRPTPLAGPPADQCPCRRPGWSVLGDRATPLDLEVGLARSVGLDGSADHGHVPGIGRRTSDQVPPAVHRPARRSIRARLYVSALGVYTVDLQRRADRRRGPRPRLDLVPPSTPLRRPSTSRMRSATATTCSGSPSPRAGTGAVSASTVAGATPTAPTSVRSPSSNCSTTTAAATPSSPIASGEQRPTRASPPASTTARPTTPGSPTPAWTTPGFDDTDWAAVDELASVADRMVAPTGPPVRRIETLRPVAIEQSPTDVTVVDFGQNLTGRVRIRVRGAAGDEVTLRHAEVLDKGELAMWLLRTAAATDTYVLAGGDDEVYEPAFTIHGFRYAERRGASRGGSTPTSIEAVVCHSRHDRRPGRSTAPTSDSTSSTRTCAGACAATSSTCPPTVRSATSASGGPATSRCSPRPPRSSTTAAGCSNRGWPTSPPSRPSSAPSRPTCRGSNWSSPRPRRRRGGTPPSSCRGCCTSASATSTCCAGSTTACGRGSTRSPRSPATTTAGPRASSSATGSTPPLRPDDPGAGRTDAALVATAYHAHTARLLARTAGVLGREADRARYDELADRDHRRVQRRVRHPDRSDGQRRPDRLRPGAALRPAGDRGATQPGRRPPRRARAPRGLPHRHRLRRHAARLRRLGRRRFRRRRLPPAAADAMPVVAVPDHDGGDDRLGAVGQLAAGRFDQPHAR